MNQQDIVRYGVTIAIVAVIFGLRVRRMSRTRPLKLETLWIIPALYAVIVVASFVAQPPAPLGWLWCSIAGAVGALAGWWRGKAISISVDPVTHALNHRASPIAIIALVVLIVLRNLARQGLAGGALGAALITEISIAFGFALIAASRAEMFIRARRLLGEARGRDALR